MEHRMLVGVVPGHKFGLVSDVPKRRLRLFGKINANLLKNL